MSIISNGGFDSDTSNWSALSSATLASVAGGQSGNCLEITNGAAAYGKAQQSFATVVNGLYRVTFYHKNGTAQGAFRLGTTSGGAEIYDSPNYNDASWTVHTYDFIATATTTYLMFINGTGTLGHTTTFDTVSVSLLTLPRFVANGFPFFRSAIGGSP